MSSSITLILKDTPETFHRSVINTIAWSRHTLYNLIDLLLEPGETEVLQVEIFNHEDEDINVNVTPATASTNQNGLIIYEAQDTFDESLQYPIADLVAMESYSIEVPANKFKVVDIQLDMPENLFEGFLLGGLRFQKELVEDDQNEESVQINNQYVYVIGLQVTEDEDQEAISNLNLTGIEPSLVNYRTAIIAKLQNNQPFILGNIDIEAEVYDANGQETIKTATLEAANFAPNSMLDFVIDWENQYLEPGDYRLKLTVSNDDDEWTWMSRLPLQTIKQKYLTKPQNQKAVGSHHNYSLELSQYL